MALAVEALDRGVLDGSVHALDLAVGPRMPVFGRSMLDVVPGAGVFEGVSSENLAVCDGLLDQRHSRAARTGRDELDAIVGQHGVDLVRDDLGYSLDQMDQERRTMHGHQSPRADIVIWESPTTKANNNTPVLVIECKSEAVDINIKD